MIRDHSEDSSTSLQVDKALQVSIERYSALLELMQLVSAKFSDQNGGVETLALALAEQQQRIEAEDATLLTQLERIPPAELEASPFFHKRLKLMGEIKEMNDLLLPKINAIMALVFQEIEELKCGRNAVSGYRAQGQRTTSKRYFPA
ncbi:MAG: hypothetical protein RBR06_08045 [Desulfuromonadaceae bacterium]|nr:hypothetical protein [Desulfuromonadaceae bacterium]